MQCGFIPYHALQYKALYLKSICLYVDRFYGYFSDVLILYFEGDLKIGCMLDIYVDVEEKYKSKCEISVNTRRQSRSASHLKRIAALK